MKENNEILKKTVTVHGKNHLKDKKENERKKIKDESFSMDEMESYELKRYMLLKKEIIGIKKSMYLGIALFGSITILLSSVFLITYNKKDTNVNVTMSKEKENILKSLKSELDGIKEGQQILAKNQKLLNTKILALNSYQETLSDEFKSKINTIYAYLKNQGKITEVLANIIMEDSVKLDKIIELKINEIKNDNIKNQSVDTTKNKKKVTNVKTKITDVKTVKQEIKRKSQGLIDKYKNLLQQLQ